MYSIHNEGKFVVAERFIRTLKNKVYKYMTSASKNMYIDKLDEIVNKYNTYHRTIFIIGFIIKMNPVDIKSSPYINFNRENNKEGHKFKVGNYVRIWKYENIFAKSYTTNWSEEVFVINKSKKYCAVDICY